MPSNEAIGAGKQLRLECGDANASTIQRPYQGFSARAECSWYARAGNARLPA